MAEPDVQETAAPAADERRPGAARRRPTAGPPARNPWTGCGPPLLRAAGRRRATSGWSRCWSLLAVVGVATADTFLTRSNC